MKITIRIAPLALAVALSGCSTTKETVKKEEPTKKETVGSPGTELEFAL